MSPIITANHLKELIAELEIKKQAQELELKQTIKKTVERFKPSNIVKNVWNQVTSSPEIKENLVDNGLGLAAGLVSRKILVGNTANPIRKLLGSLAQYGISNIVANHADPIKTIGINLWRMILKKNRKRAGTNTQN